MIGLWAFEVQLPYQKYQGSAIVVRLCITISESTSDYDAILFHARDLDMKDLPDQTFRNPKQYYVMFLEESPQMDSYPAMEFFSFDFSCHGLIFMC